MAEKNKMLDFELQNMPEEDTHQNENEENHVGGFTGLKEPGHLFCCVSIIGQIEGHYLLSSNIKTTKYEHILPRLAAMEEDEGIDGLLLLVNTVGGDIEAGLAMAELIAGMKKPTVSLVLGGGHSIGVPIAVSAKYSFIAKSASMTLHPVRMNGLVLGVEQAFDYFRNIQERIVGFVCRNSSIQPARFRELMLTTGELAADLGTNLNGEEAVKEGLINAVGSLSDALAKLRELSEQKNS